MKLSVSEIKMLADTSFETRNSHEYRKHLSELTEYYKNKLVGFELELLGKQMAKDQG